MENDLPSATPPPALPNVPVSAASAPQPSSRKAGRGWLFWMLMLGVVLLLALAAGAYKFSRAFTHGMRAAHLDGRYYEEHVLEQKGSDDKIAVLDVDGIISSHMREGGVNMVTALQDQLKLAAKDDAVKAVLLRVDSPGGEVLASDEIYRAIQKFQQESDKPVIAAMGSLAASGGYYVSAPCRWIVANELTITGSIGVIMQTYNYRGLMNKVGVQPMTFKSGKFKDMLSGDKNPEDVQPEERQMVQKLIDETFGKFKAIVADGREQALKTGQGQRKLADDWRDYADGRIFSGREAHERGFVDELGDFEVAVKRAEKLVGVSDATLIQYQSPFDFMNVFRLFGQSSARSVKVDLGLDLPKVQVGRLYYLSPLGLH